MNEFQNGGIERADSVFVLKNLPAMVWRRKWYLVVSLAVTLGLGGIYLALATTIYEVDARVLVQKTGVNLEGNRPLTGDKDFQATQAQIMRSPMIINAVLKDPSVRFTPPRGSEKDPVLLILQSLTVDPVRGADVLQIRYLSPNAEEALHLVGAIITSFKEYIHQETLVMLGNAGDRTRIQQALWDAQSHEKELGEIYGDKHPELRAAREQIAMFENLLADTQLSDDALARAQAEDRVRLLDGPSLADSPVWPRPVLLWAVCAVIGLTGGFGLICLLDRIDSRFRSVEQLRDRVGLPILAQIPAVQAVRGKDAWLHRARLVHELPLSAAAEAFRALRTRLLAGGGPPPGRVIAVVSPHAGEGKTMTVGNLAFSFSLLGQSVVVVDADLRQGSLGQIFSVPAARGLTSVLRDGVPVDEAVERSPRAPIDVLSRGPDAKNPVELLAQPEFDKVLHVLRERYDVVLVDTPAALAVTDASLVAAKADGVLLALMLGESTSEESSELGEILASVGARVLGVVLGRVPHAAHSRARGAETRYSGAGEGDAASRRETAAVS